MTSPRSLITPREDAGSFLLLPHLDIECFMPSNSSSPSLLTLWGDITGTEEPTDQGISGRPFQELPAGTLSPSAPLYEPSVHSLAKGVRVKKKRIRTPKTLEISVLQQQLFEAQQKVQQLSVQNQVCEAMHSSTANACHTFSTNTSIIGLCYERGRVVLAGMVALQWSTGWPWPSRNTAASPGLPGPALSGPALRCADVLRVPGGATPPQALRHRHALYERLVHIRNCHLQAMSPQEPEPPQAPAEPPSSAQAGLDLQVARPCSSIMVGPQERARYACMGRAEFAGIWKAFLSEVSMCLLALESASVPQHAPGGLSQPLIDSGSACGGAAGGGDGPADAATTATERLLRLVRGATYNMRNFSIFNPEGFAAVRTAAHARTGLDALHAGWLRCMQSAHAHTHGHSMPCTLCDCLNSTRRHVPS